MHAPLAFMNGVSTRRRGFNEQADREQLLMLDTLLSTSGSEPPALDKGVSKDERQAEEESKHPTASKPGGFKNDPDDPTNPNEVRERHVEKLNR